MNFIDMYKKIAEIDRAAPMYERVTVNPDGTRTPSFADQMRANGAQSSPEPAQPAVVPLNKRFDPRFKNGPEPYTIDIDGVVYKFAGRDKSAPGGGEVIKVPAAVIGIRGLGAVSVELGKDGMYYPAPASNEAAEEVEQPLDEVAQLRKDLGLDLLSESLMDECGDMPMPGAMAHSDQADSVTMNISMNGSGKGGIKDLMDILKNIEDGPSDSGAEIVIGSNIDDMEHPFDEVYANEPDTEVQPIDAVIPTGNDLSSKGAEAPKVNGGGNPMTMESLKSQLDRLYQEIKEGADLEVRGKHKGKPLAEFGVNLTQPRTSWSHKGPAEYDDKANTDAMSAKYDAMIKQTGQELAKEKADPRGSPRHIQYLQDQIKGLEKERMHNMFVAMPDDATNALRKQAIANNELTPGQWLQKATQYFKGKITGQPQPGVEYDRVDTLKQLKPGWITPTPYKPGQ